MIIKGTFKIGEKIAPNIRFIGVRAVGEGGERRVVGPRTRAGGGMILISQL